MNVFISRDLPKDSVFLQELQILGIEVSAKSLISFRAHPFDIPTTAEWLFFYSKRAVRFFFEKAIHTKGDTENQAKLACIGQGTADFLLKTTGYKSDFTGNGVAEETAPMFLKLAKNQKVAFIRAFDSKKSVQQIVANHLEIIDCIVYENSPVSDECSFSGQVLVFTSPLNARVYFSKNALMPSQQIVAIGLSTAGALDEMGLKKYVIAEEPSEKALVEAVMKLIV